MSFERDRVVVTGIGLVTAIGQDRKTTWTNLLAGKTGIEPVYAPRLGDAVIPLARVDLLQADMPRVERLILPAVNEAIADAGLVLPPIDCGIVVGSSRSYQREWELLMRHDSQSRLPRSDWLNLLPGNIARLVATQTKTQSIVLSPMAACATGNWAIAQAYEAIQMGKCTMAIAAAVDAPIVPLSIAGFQKLGAMARTGLYPFSREREGLVLGEGAAAIVMESESALRSRGCVSRCYGEILGFGLTNDAWHPTSPDPEHTQAERAIHTCLDRAGINAEDVGHINLHGTGTQLNDASEAKLAARIFPHAPHVSATKGATGHVLGATGMMEAAFCLMALREQVLPPCTGMRSPEFDLNFTHNACEVEHRIALNVSFGFGGQNAVVAFGRSKVPIT
ncbi:beta-ketoacyl synthase N-terminal-like domain-containing protein [Pseudanabaena sp. PCC 6802]|uniref:beta-ketoacyl synthase N-terminal-like domain-containing protein n=1 Tax=Pseudanabaena sp. PCC 6802 TaxID=118173 RepID=UPI00034797AE|nr:beta-ketoacyl synthase N-terminal-like domain-containing protein [Pseudanabaena sp. PCC 6802]